ncbi:inorganic pyrophosphatase isoform X2 [Hylaeus anthracinus]|uniref:inorganic pyrophosphatase isoform X2 n=1 Tax=Hylaeus volcanicus TaxID=313075 RepID=UPI0023B853C9|nr:inorganic pyrophosphatase isoform X2 [Hylaeus volcanicus]XP_054003776.1 inorganic pyrophosphatase isoform X2 [Hylaeus anthracinus]
MSPILLHVLRCRSLNKLAIPVRLVPTVTTVNSQLCSVFNKFVRNMSYTTIERGTLNTVDYRIYFKNNAGPISPMHDIPLYADEANKIVNMVVEIPRWTNAKMEINLKETLNPIKQDIKKGKLRYVANCFPHHGYIWNYGALPQTWENPDVLDEATGYKGDNDPIDVIEIGYRVAKRGEILKVKILGTVALIDEGETDWKIIVIDVNDPLAEQMNDVADIEKHYPGLMKATIEWFKIYKIPDGKPENQFAFNGEAKSRDFALHVVEEVHQHWQNLIKREAPAGGIACTNVTIADSPFKISVDTAEEILEKAPETSEPQLVDPSVDKWHYVHLK